MRFIKYVLVAITKILQSFNIILLTSCVAYILLHLMSTNVIAARNDRVETIKSEAGCFATSSYGFEYRPYVWPFNKGVTYVYEVSKVEHLQVVRAYDYAVDKALPDEKMDPGTEVRVWNCGSQDPRQAVTAIIASRRAHSWCGTYTTPWGLVAEDVCLSHSFGTAFEAVINFMAELSRSLARTFDKVWARWSQ